MEATRLFHRSRSRDVGHIVAILAATTEQSVKAPNRSLALLQQQLIDRHTAPDQHRIASADPALDAEKSAPSARGGFRNRRCAGVYRRALARSGLPAARLELEVTESLLQKSAGNLAILHASSTW
jgi:hypothetical protein